MPQRTIVEEHRFVDELAQIEPDVRRSDAALHYVKDVLSRDPTVGLRGPDPGVLVAPMVLDVSASPGWILASVYYIATESHVHLLSIRLE